MSHVSVSWDLDTRRDDKNQKETTKKKKFPNTNDVKGKQNIVSGKRWKQIENCVLQVWTYMNHFWPDEIITIR